MFVLVFVLVFVLILVFAFAFMCVLILVVMDGTGTSMEASGAHIDFEEHESTCKSCLCKEAMAQWPLIHQSINLSGDGPPSTLLAWYLGSGQLEYE